MTVSRQDVWTANDGNVAAFCSVSGVLIIILNDVNYILNDILNYHGSTEIFLVRFLQNDYYSVEASGCAKPGIQSQYQALGIGAVEITLFIVHVVHRPVWELGCLWC